MLIEVKTSVFYTYELTQGEENKIRKLISENKNGEFDYMNENQKISKAFEILYGKGETNLYQNDNTVESEFSTDGFSFSEFNNCSAKEWLKQEPNTAV